MKPTAEELDRLRTKPRNGHPTLANTEALFLLQQAAVNSTLLTGSVEWDYFLSQMQFWLQKTREQASTFRLAIENPYATDAMAQGARRDLILCNERIAVLEAVMNFPSQVKAAGEKAKIELEAIGEKRLEQSPE